MTTRHILSVNIVNGVQRHQRQPDRNYDVVTLSEY
jgi:hypothetical protein